MTTEATTEGEAPETPTTETTTTDTAAEIAKWKDLARKHEDRAKANAGAAKELETFRQQSMTETERAVENARTEGRAEGARTAGERVARAEIRAAAAGRQVDVDALLEGVDPKRFLDDDGEPDTKAIAAWMNRVAPQPEEPTKPAGFPDLGQGARGGQTQAMALNGDPLLAHLKDKLGVR